ncbi:hypothetical protein MKX01_009206 [Papaver californicum]|nr:hypothetical protein MKX01_009206 [Papaver californicum]
MGYFGMFKEAFRITFSWRKLFSQILLATILPTTILYLSAIQISDFIQSHTYQNNKKAKWIVFGITKFIYSVLILFLYLFSTSSVVYSVSCFYTSKDTNFKKVISVFTKVWGRLLVTLLLFIFIMAIYSFVTLGSLVLFVSREFGSEGEGAYKVLAFLICMSIPYFVAYVYITIVWNIAMVISVLENDYGVKALVRSMKLIKGKIWVSSAIFITLEIVFAGLIIAFSLLVLDGKILNLVGNIFVGIVCYLLAAFMLHFSLVIQALVYFVCKAYHNEGILDVAAHLDVSYGDSVTGNEEV